MESQRRVREYFVQLLPTLRAEVIYMIGAIAALVSLFYALQLPVCIVAVLEYSGKTRIGVGASALGLYRARNRALYRLHHPARKKHLSLLEKTGLFDDLLHGAKYLYAHRLLLRVSVNGELGGTDAARLAVCWGAAQSLLDTLCACTGGQIAGTLRPNFAAAQSHAEIRVTYAVKTGTALKAGLQAVCEHLIERVKTWKSIPLKA